MNTVIYGVILRCMSNPCILFVICIEYIRIYLILIIMLYIRKDDYSTYIFDTLFLPNVYPFLAPEYLMTESMIV